MAIDYQGTLSAPEDQVERPALAHLLPALMEPQTCSIVEILADCLETDLLNVQEKYNLAVQEITRLKEHLIALDTELTEEGQKRDQLVERFKERINELQAEIVHWRKLYEAQNVLGEAGDGDDDESDDDDDDELLKRIELITKELSAAQRECEAEQCLSAKLKEAIKEKEEEIEDVTVALRHLESRMKEEIKVGVAESKDQLIQAHKTIDQLKNELEDARAEAQAVPDLKRKIAELDVSLERLQLEKPSNEGDLVDKALMANLLVNLFDQNRPVDRRQVALMICNLLDITQEDQLRMGLSNESTSDPSNEATK